MRSSSWRFGVVALALAASAACLSQDVRVCSDGSVCPDFLACSPAGGCVEEALLCDVAGEPCTLPGGEAGLCRAGVCEQPRCGDRVIDEALGEMCDDGNALDGDGCARDCASDETCGNGVRDEDEGCDDGNVIDGDTCQAGCALPTCGDGILDDGEACDDGDANADDAACLPTCVAARCGDGRVQAGVEACDLGGANANDAACLPGCVAASCGDGHRWAVAEACDDGNVVDGDGCQADCALPRCGDGIEDPGEDCDDGAGNSETGACRLTCQDATCGDGRVWAGVEACDQGEDNGDDAGCTAACEDASCGDGLVWAGVEACDDGNQVEGDGCQADCALPRCGDDVVDPGEVCDDGDNQPGDGCAFDCSSTEVCGNGLIDYFVGEACDDANLTPYDGCTRCQADAPPLWTEHLQAPGGRAGTAMAYDVHRQVVVLYGGDANQRLSDTWEWDGRAWLRRFPVHSPGRLAFHAMAYDPVRRRTVLVGGLGVAGASGRTWEWDGVDWLEQSGDDPERPGAVYGHAIAFHPQTSQMVLAGGVGRDRKTYIREGTLWLERGELPEELEFPAMATVPSTGNVILAGGNRGLEVHAKVLRWSGDSWLSLPDLPIGVTQHVLVADGLTGRLHLVGGMDPEQPEQARHWIGDGASWEEAAPLPTPVRQAAAAWDLARGALVHFGGTSNATGYSAATTRWTPDDGISVVPAPASPGAVQFATMAYDSWRGELVLVGGTTLAGPVTETWIWDGSSWATRGPAPGPRLEAAMAFDESAGVMVLFGGRDGGSTLTDTLMWDGSSWADGGSSDGRYGASMAYEPSLGKVVRSGGNAGGPVAFETLAYDVAAATWLDLGLPSPPSYGGPMITTPAGVLLYQANVLWLLSPGSGWTPYHSGPPAPSGVVGMAFDPLLGRPVVFGDPDTWEFDGSRWTFPETRNAPDVRRSHVLAHDPRSHRTFVVGGSQNGGVYFDETWSYRWEGEREEVCLAGFDGDGDGAVGCDDPDCWTFCRPACPPDQACPADAPVCGDAACDPLETPRLCPGDCGPPQPACGDGHVDAGELECLYDQMAPGG